MTTVTPHRDPATAIALGIDDECLSARQVR